MTQIKCTFPPSYLGQTKGNWRKKSRLVKTYREKWGWEFARYKKALEGKTEFKIGFAPPDKRRRDVTNCQMAFKAGIDALADVVGIDDSKFKIMWNREFLPPVVGGAVVVEVLK